MTGGIPDPERRPWATQVFAHRLMQPDRLSCGASALVAARVLTDEAYAEAIVGGRHPGTRHRLTGASVPHRFRDEALAMHRRVTGPVDLHGRMQLPWPRLLGTPPWAVARQLGSSYTSRVVRPYDRDSGYDALLAALPQGPAALFIGSRWLPRHIVLVLAGTTRALSVYDPGTGVIGEVEQTSFNSARVALSGWDVPWLMVIRPTRHTPA